MDCSTPDFPVLHYLSKFAQTHVHWVNGAIHKEIQRKFFITALLVVATTLEITGRLRKRKHEINPSIHILWIISHLWKTHESHQCSLTWKDIPMSLNGLKRKASCWVTSVIWSPQLFFSKSKQETRSGLCAFGLQESVSRTSVFVWYRHVYVIQTIVFLLSLNF